MLQRVRRAALALAAAAAAVVPAGAGTVYVPVMPAGDAAAGGAAPVSQVRLYVTNLDTENRSNFRVRANPLWATAPGADAPGWEQYFVNPGVTRVVTLEAPEGTLLEVDLDAGRGGLTASAEQLRPGLDFKAAGSDAYVQLPVVTPANAVTADGRATVLGVSRAGALTTDLGFVNLEEGDASCSVSIWDAAGTQLNKSGIIVLRAKSFASFSDVPDKFSLGEIEDSRLEITCTGSGAKSGVASRMGGAENPAIFVFARRSSPNGITFLGTAATGDEAAPGSGDPQDPEDPKDPEDPEDPEDPGDPGDGEIEVEKLADGSVAFRIRGDFHHGSWVEPSRVFNIPLGANNRFSKVNLSFDFFHGGYLHGEESSTYSLFWLHRGGLVNGKWPKWQSNVYGFANAIGGGKNSIKVMTNVDRGSARDAFVDKAALQPGQTYHVTYEWNAPTKSLRLQLFHKASGNLVAQVSGTTFGKLLQTDGQGMFFVYFGHEDHTGVGPERPGIDWVWSDLEGKFTK